MILQKKIQSDYVSKRNKPKVYYCFNCNGQVILEDLLEIDKKLGKLNPEDHEFLLDELPNSNNPRRFPFIHKCNLGYDVLNICKSCFKNAYNKLFEENSD